ncbi:MAG: RodZ domain-containing protein [Thermodesulfobacteriota bacterium]
MGNKSFEALGRRLREERERKGLTLRQLSDRTKIPLHVLEDVEAGDPTALPASVFVKGFLRTMALELGLSPAEVIQEFKILNPEPDRPVAVPITAREELERSSRLRNMFLVMLLLVVGLGAGILFYYPRWLNGLFQSAANTTGPSSEGGRIEAPAGALGPAAKVKSGPESVAPPQTAPGSGAPLSSLPAPAITSVSTDKPASSAETAAARSGQASRTEPAASTPTGGHELKIVFEKECWLQLVIDNGQVQHYRYGPGTTKTWKAEKKFFVRLGNAGGVKIFYNGQPLGSPGPEGKAVNLVLPRANG